VEKVKEWQNRRLQEKYRVMFLDGLYNVKEEGVVRKTRDGLVGIGMQGHKGKYWGLYARSQSKREVLAKCVDGNKRKRSKRSSDILHR
jgi:hypothetical protein